MRQLPVLSLVLSLVLSACSGDRRSAAPPADAASGDMYARVTKAMSRPGQVFHTVMSEETTQGDSSYRRRTEASIDLGAGVARSDVETTFGSGATHHGIWLVAGDAWYQTQEDGAVRKRAAPRCHNATSAALAVVLGCRSFFERSATSVEPHSTFEARAAIALVTAGTDTGAGDETEFTDTLYIDAESYLPIALVGRGTIQHGGAIPSRTTIRYENSFVAGDSLDPSTWAPASLGYAERDVEEGLHATGADPGIVWAGREIEMPDGAPPVSLRQAAVQPRELQSLVGYRATLAYGRSDDEFALPEIRLRERRAEDWAADSARATGEWWAASCVREVAIADQADASLYAPSASCGGGPGGYAAHARVGDTIVVVEALAGSPYATAGAMEAIVAALRAY